MECTQAKGKNVASAACSWRTLGNLLVKALKLVCVEANSVPLLSGRGTWGSKVSVWLVGWAIMELGGAVPEILLATCELPASCFVQLAQVLVTQIFIWKFSKP